MSKDIEKKQSKKPAKATSKTAATKAKAKDTKVAKATQKPKKQHKIRRYFKDLKSEFKKVVWPTKKQIINNTGVVLAAMVASGIFIWALDMGLSQLLKLVLQKG